MEHTPLKEMTRMEIVKVIEHKYPEIEDAIRTRYLTEKGSIAIASRPDEFILWFRMIQVSKNEDIPMGTRKHYKLELLNTIVSDYITPYIQQYQELSRQWLEYYEILAPLCHKWEVDELEIGEGIKLPGKAFNVDDALYNLK